MAAATANTSKNTILCHACTEDVKDEYVSCQGFCNAVFHLHCSSAKPELLKEIASHRQIFWLCRSCSSLMVDLRHRRSVQSAYEAGQELSLSHHNRIVEQLKSELLSDLKTELSANFAKLIASNSLTPKSASHGAGGFRGSGSRRLFNNPAPPLRPHPMPPQHDTGKPKETADVVEGVVAEGYGTATEEEVPRFWLYLSRVSRNVTEAQIAKLAVDRLGVVDVKVKRLVAKGKDVSRMRFISFKVGVHVDLKHKALASATWPDGLVFREFEERNAEIFWEPSSAVVNTQENPPPPPSQPLTTPTTPSLPPESAPQSTPKKPEHVLENSEDTELTGGLGGSPMDHQTD